MIASGPPQADGDVADRRIAPLTAGLLLAAGGTVIAGIAIAAASAGPLVAHPDPPHREPPPSVDLPTMELPTMPPVSSRPVEIDLGWLWWVGAVLAALAAVFLVAVLVRHLRRRRRRATRPGAPAARANRDPFAIDHVAEPADVDAEDGRTFDALRAADDIITTWRVLQDAAARIGMPRRRADTPTEFLAMLTDRFGDPRMDTAAARAEAPFHPTGFADAARSEARAAATLLPLYHRARFDIERLAPGAASTARAAAAALLASWPDTASPDPASGPGEAGRADGRRGGSSPDPSSPGAHR